MYLVFIDGVVGAVYNNGVGTLGRPGSMVDG